MNFPLAECVRTREIEKALWNRIVLPFHWYSLLIQNHFRCIIFMMGMQHGYSTLCVNVI